MTGSAATSVGTTNQLMSPDGAPYLLPHCVTPVTASTLIRKAFVLLGVTFTKIAGGALKADKIKVASDSNYLPDVGVASVIAVPADTMGKAGSLAEVNEPARG